MSRGSNARLSQRIAEEAQLLTEEKWMINALKKLKELRNCLQIERLHLENERSQLKGGVDKKSAASSALGLTTDNFFAKMSLPSTSNENSLQMPQNNSVNNELMGFEVPIINDELCNQEELNLAVTNSVFMNQDTNAFDMEEEEEEDMDNCMIDMNMFMYGLHNTEHNEHSKTTGNEEQG